MTAPEQVSHEEYERALAEHKQLRARLEETERAIEETEQATQALVEFAQRAAALLSQLADQMTAHFAAEERSGYFQDLIEQAPRMASKTQELLAEHAELAAEVNRLAEQARQASAASASSGAFADAFRAFSKKLLHHEHAENTLMQEVYTRDIGSKD